MPGNCWLLGLPRAGRLSLKGARQHSPGDVAAGSAMGWLIGDYVHGRRHNRDLDQRPGAARRFLNQVHFGAEIR